MFCIYWGEITEASDGPLEWCLPVSKTEGLNLDGVSSELSLRTEPAHLEAYVSLPRDRQLSTDEWALVSESFQSWAGITGAKAGELGIRMTYLYEPPATTPDCDFAAPLNERFDLKIVIEFRPETRFHYLPTRNLYSLGAANTTLTFFDKEIHTYVTLQRAIVLSGIIPILNFSPAAWPLRGPVRGFQDAFATMPGSLTAAWKTVGLPRLVRSPREELRTAPALTSEKSA